MDRYKLGVSALTLCVNDLEDRTDKLDLQSLVIRIKVFALYGYVKMTGPQP